MPVNKVRGRGSYAPLSAHAYKDDALAEAGEAAELLFYRGLSFAADVINDGFISDSQLSRLVGQGMRGLNQRANRLVDVGLWTRETGGYRIRSWLKWNRSLSDITHLQRKDADRKAVGGADPSGTDADPDPDSSGNPDGIQAESNRTDSDGPLDSAHQRQYNASTTPEPEPERSGRKRPAIKLPADWSPTDNHKDLAAKNQLDLQREVFRFRNHAEANDRRQASWNAAFTTWLDKAPDYARPTASAANLRPWVEQ